MGTHKLAVAVGYDYIPGLGLAGQTAGQVPSTSRVPRPTPLALPVAPRSSGLGRFQGIVRDIGEYLPTTVYRGCYIERCLCEDTTA
jgi:hypothetical protein